MNWYSIVTEQADSSIQGAWILAIERQGPSVLSLARQAVLLLQGTAREKTQKGAYVISENPSANVTLVSTGSEVCHSVDAAKRLRQMGYSVRVVSMPCMQKFEQ